MNDIRLTTNYFNHPKIIKLARRQGVGAVIAHQKLLMFARDNRPDGVLNGMDHEDIEIACCINNDLLTTVNDESTFVNDLINVRLIDVDDANNYVIHDWIDHNPYAVGTEDRSNKARFSRLKGAYPELYAKLEENGYKSVTKEEYDTFVKDYLTNQRAVDESLTNVTTNVKGALTPSPSPSPSKYSYDESQMQFAEKMFEKIKIINPSMKKPNLKSWANTIRLCVEQDNRTIYGLNKVFEWANKDPFWQGNILSPEKLRKQFDQLEIKMNGCKPQPVDEEREYTWVQ